MATTIGVLCRMLEVRVPKLFPTHTVREQLTVEQWFVREGDTLRPDELMVSLEAPPGFFEIPAPPDVTVPHRVVQIHVTEGEEIHLNDAYHARTCFWERRSFYLSIDIENNTLYLINRGCCL